MASGFIHLDNITISQWPEPNFIDPKSRRWLLAYIISMTVLTFATVFARLLSQAKKSTHGLGIDDNICIIGWMFSVFLTTTISIGIQHYGFERHIWDVPRTQYNGAALIYWLSEGAFTFSTCFTKISVLLFFRRIKPSCSTALKCVIYAFIIFTACTSLADALVLILQCRPTTASWRVLNPADTDTRHCIDKHVYYPVHGSLACFSTTYTVMIASLVLRYIPMTKFQRTGMRWIISSVLGAGIARTVFLYRFATSVVGDATWNGFNVFVCAQTECHLALICASLPFLHPFFAPHSTVPTVFRPTGDEQHQSILSRISGFVRSGIKCLHGRSSQTPNPSAPPLPQTVEIPENKALRSPGGTIRTSIETTYERYRKGEYGPPVPPKDLGDWLEMYRREHGQMARGYPF